MSIRTAADDIRAGIESLKLLVDRLEHEVDLAGVSGVNTTAEPAPEETIATIPEPSGTQA
jgi:hypothetical protein